MSVKETSDAMKNGVRFWCPARCDSPDSAFRYADEPFPKKKGVHYAPGEYGSQKLRLRIMGEDWFTKPHLVYELAKVAVDERKRQGKLRWNPQEAVDKGLLTIEQLQELGYKGLTPRAVAPASAPPPATDVPPPPPESAKAPGEQPEKVEEVQKPAPVAAEEVLPDFETMHMSELREWADVHGIFLDGRWGKETSINKVKEALKDSKGFSGGK